MSLGGVAKAASRSPSGAFWLFLAGSSPSLFSPPLLPFPLRDAGSHAMDLQRRTTPRRCPSSRSRMCTDIVLTLDEQFHCTSTVIIVFQLLIQMCWQSGRLFMLRAWMAGAPSTGSRPVENSRWCPRLGRAGGQQQVDARISTNDVAFLKLWRSAHLTQ
jgi:hypothetical protein